MRESSIVQPISLITLSERHTIISVLNITLSEILKMAAAYKLFAAVNKFVSSNMFELNGAFTHELRILKIGKSGPPTHSAQHI